MSKNKFGEPWSTRRGTFTTEAFESMQEELTELAEEMGELSEQYAEFRDGLIVDGATKYGKAVSDLKRFIAKSRLAIEMHNANN